jgi:hypothetical protein
MLSARTLRDFARSSLDTVANERLGKIQKAAIQGFVRTQRHSRLAAAATAADVDTPPVLSPAQVRYNLMPEMHEREERVSTVAEVGLGNPEVGSTVRLIGLTTPEFERLNGQLAVISRHVGPTQAVVTVDTSSGLRQLRVETVNMVLMQEAIPEPSAEALAELAAGNATVAEREAEAAIASAAVANANAAVSAVMLTPGAGVQLVGLTSDHGSPLNGQKGTALEWLVDRERWSVRLNDGDATINVKPTNLLPEHPELAEAFITAAAVTAAAAALQASTTKTAANARAAASAAAAAIAPAVSAGVNATAAVNATLDVLYAALGWDETDFDGGVTIESENRTYRMTGAADTSAVGGTDPKKVEEELRGLMLPLDAVLLGGEDSTGAVQKGVVQVDREVPRLRQKVAEAKAELMRRKKLYEQRNTPARKRSKKSQGKKASRRKVEEPEPEMQSISEYEKALEDKSVVLLENLDEEGLTVKIAQQLVVRIVHRWWTADATAEVEDEAVTGVITIHADTTEGVWFDITYPKSISDPDVVDLDTIMSGVVVDDKEIQVRARPACQPPSRQRPRPPHTPSSPPTSGGLHAPSALCGDGPGAACCQGPAQGNADQ